MIRKTQWNRLFPDRIAYFDGGMGTLLQAMGLQGGQRPERWNLLYPQRVRAIHESYLQAGAEVITSNTFGATAEHLGDEAAACMEAGVRLAKEAVTAAGRGYAAIDMGSLGRLPQPYGDLPFEEAVTQFRNAFLAGIQGGGDLILIETMTDLLEVKACVLAAREAIERAGKPLPLLVSLTFDQRGRLLSGADIPGTVAMLAGLRVDAIGLNCGHEPKALRDNAAALLACSPLPAFINPNASLPRVENGKTVYPTQPEEFAGDMRPFAEQGFWGLGGCCGTTPEHIAALVNATRGMEPAPRNVAEGCVLSGSARSVALGGRPVLIGERLNPTGKKRMKQALLAHDMDYLRREAVAQAEAGADVLDVNAGLPELDEVQALREAMEAVQTVCDLPLQADSASPAALEAAIRPYAGRPAINSVCGKQAVMDAVFPIAARYGAALVALPLDENGIPNTAEGRCQIAERMVAEAAKYGLTRSDLIFDGLTMTAAVGESPALTTLQTLRLLKERLGVSTVLGVSNVSFGLPQRPLLNAAFLAMAIGCGLDAAIMNPGDPTGKALFDGASALAGGGPGMEAFLRGYGGEGVKYAVSATVSPSPGDNMGRLCNSPETANHPQASPCNPAALGNQAAPGAPLPASATSSDDLYQAILKGLPAAAATAAQAGLNRGRLPLALIEASLMPALAAVGDKYQRGALFLPQLLQSAAAAQAAFETLRAGIPAAPPDPAGKIVLATVKGDVHDIGKNIVKVLLQNYGFTVIDLGKDVPPEKVLEAVQAENAAMVGLSALMTTTVPAMADTVALLHREAPATRVLVGGAVLTQAYADQIQADGYARDAMAAVEACQAWKAAPAAAKG